MFKKILAPVDPADVATARPALDAAARLASISDGVVRLISVRSLMPVTYMEYIPANFEETISAETERALQEAAAGVALPRDRISIAVRTGSVYGEVLEEAKSFGADLIVVGSHRPSMATYLLGSNATTIVRHALCNVLVVRG
jgi:nucleotide-binding universal stress UspA family protein